jgi:predicted ribosomally synthesized peptide with SipW-like signal peptide
MSTNGNRAKRMRLLLAFGAGALAIASMMTGAMSLALFTDQQNVNNTFTAGTIKLDGPGIATLALTSTNMMPGDSKSSSVTVKNDGSSQLRYAVSATSTNPDTLNLRSQLLLTVKTQGTSCATFDGTSLFSGALNATTAIVGSPTQGFQTGDRNLAAAGQEVLCFQIQLPLATVNAYQGATTVTTFTFDAEQTANN